MCIISFHIQQHPLYKLIVIANRDEQYNRPTAPAHFWTDVPDLLAGRDLKAMGTWMGMTRKGRFAALTNYRHPTTNDGARISRGHIVADFLKSDVSATNYIQTLQQHRDDYAGFNLLVGTVDALYFYNREENEIISLDAGTYSVSNASLNTPWPKVVKARDRLKDYVRNHKHIDTEILFKQLADDTPAATEALPDTGVGQALEKLLSPIFIRAKAYGTRSSTVLLVTHQNEVTFLERTFHKGVPSNNTIHEKFIIQ